jgi:hypothetical protein
MKELNITPNHFYRKQTITNDTVLNQTYPDAYLGTDATVRIGNGEVDTFYLADSSILPDPAYGGGNLSELFLKVDVNSTKTRHLSYVPAFKVFKLKNSYTLTEGALTSGNVDLSVYTSRLSYSTPLVNESFDGANKGFGRDEMSYRLNEKRYRSHENDGRGTYVISHNNLLQWYLSDEGVKYAQSFGIYLSNINPPQNTRYHLVYVESNEADHQVSHGSRTRPAAWYCSGAPWLTKGGEKAGGYHARGPGMAELSAWINAGAYVSFEESGAPGIEVTKETAIETYRDYLTPYNTVFNSMYQAPSDFDIKVQNLESSGIDEFPFTQTEGVFTTDDFLTGGASARFKCFWENYSGTLTGDGAQSLANPFGLVAGKYALPQTSFATITDIPQIRALELLSGTSTGLLPSPANTTAPEWEITFKVNQLEPAPGVSTDGDGYTTGITAHRSINFIWANLPPREEDTYWSYQKWIYDEWVAGRGAFMQLQGINTGWTGSGSFTLLQPNTTDSEVSAGYQTSTGINVYNAVSPAILVSGGFQKYGVTLPQGEWIKMRCRPYGNTGSNCPWLFYFPELSADENGKMRYMIGDGTYNNLRKGGLSNFSFGLSNMRSMGPNAAGGNVTHIDYGFVPDRDGGKKDREVNVLIDNIVLTGYNHTINCSNAGKDGMAGPGTMRIDNDIKVPVNPPPSARWNYQESYSSSADPLSVNAYDNYYAMDKTPSPTILSFGFDTSSIQNDYVMLQDFLTLQSDTAEPLDNMMMKWGYSDDSPLVGPVRTNMFVLSGSGEPDTDTDIQTEGEPYLVDNFSQKGFIKFPLSGNGVSGWVPRENPFVSAIITHIDDAGTTIKVDNPSIFNEPIGVDGQKYVVYVQGLKNTAIGTNLYADFNVGSGSIGQVNDDLYQITPAEGNTITLNRPINGLDDAKTQTMAKSTFTQSNAPRMHRCLISPKKYWIWGMLQTTTGARWGEWYNEPYYSGTALGMRSYTNALFTTDTGTPGSTYNEFLYVDGAYQKRWIVDPTFAYGVIDLSKDYGYGAFKEATEDESTVLGGYITEDYVGVTGDNYFDLTSAISVDKLKANDSFNFAIVPATDDIVYYNMIIDSSEGTTPPQLIYGYDVTLLSLDGFNIIPAVDLLAEDADIADLAKGVGANVRCVWSEEGNNIENLWYRLVWADTNTISNKYHTANFIAPLNETGSTAYYYTSAKNYVGGTSVALTGTNLPDIEGFLGYGTKLAGATTLSSSAAPITLGSASEYTFISHLKPSAVNGTFFCASSSSLEVFRGYLSSSQIVIEISGAAATLTSTTSYDCDGIQPLAVVVTYDQALDNNNLKLFVNGKLEDTADYTVDFPSASLDAFIGGQANGETLYSGFVEEITFHSKRVFVAANPNSFILPTKTLSDLSSGQSNFYNARLFAFDYHNIRGASSHEVARSNMSAWKVTGI